MLTVSNQNLSFTCKPLGAELANVTFKGLPVADQGTTKGRVGNRIAGAVFELNGTTYTLPKNDGENTLHSGPGGFSKRVWEESPIEQDGTRIGVRYRLFSPDKDMGFPGNLHAEVRYLLQDNDVRIEMEAVCDQDTIINMVNHAYFNLNGLNREPASLHTHRLRINADRYTQVRADKIPTGTLPDVDGTDFDFRSAKTLTGYFDHNFVLNESGLEQPEAVLEGLESGIILEVLTDQPGIQLYNTPTEICLEAQNFPDAIHHAHFPSPILRQGEIYRATVIYRFR